MAALSLAAGGMGSVWLVNRGLAREAAQASKLEELNQRCRSFATSEARFRLLTDGAADVLFRFFLQPGLKVDYVSPSISRLTGYSPSELSVDAESLKELFSALGGTSLIDAERTRNEPGYPVVAMLKRRDGSHAWVEFWHTLETDDSGSPVAIHGGMRDITESRRVAEARREGEERLGRIVETVADGLLILTRKGNVNFANAAAVRIFGLPQGSPIESWIEVERRTGFGAALVSLLEAFKFEDGCRNFHYTITQQDGESVILSVNADALPSSSGRANLVVASVRDVTLERRTEQGLVESEARLTILNGILSVIAAGCGFDEIVVRTLQHIGTYFPKKLITYSRLGTDATLSLVACSKKAPEMKDMRLPAESDLARLLLGGALVRVEDALTDPNCRPVSETLAEMGVRSFILSPFSAGEGRVGVLGMFYHDVCNWSEYEVKTMREAVEHLSVAHRQAGTEEQRKIAKTALAAEKERLAVTLKSITDAVVAVDASARIVLFNEAAERLTGWSQQDAAGHPVAEVFPLFQEKEKLGAGLVVTGVLIHGRSVDSADTYRLEPRFGGQRLVTQSAGPIHDANGGIAGAVAVFRDVTVKRRAEEEMFRASKLESVGVLAGGIAHDFNNILTIVLGSISLARLSCMQDSEQASQLEKAAQGCLRARDLTQQLLTFSRGGAPIKRAASLEEIVRESVGFAMRGANVSCQVQAEPGLWPVEVDPAQINQVVHNLVLNAVQAMPKGGKLGITLSNKVLQPADPTALAPGKYVSLLIEDSGEGIPEENLAHIFDPYFTTKDSGTGLGLATTYSIIQRHRGHISVQSTSGVGTQFHIKLPAADKTPATMARPAAFKRGSGKILVMDDEAMIRDLSKAMLLALGYKVELAADGSQALDLYKKALDAGERFDAVIMDLTVPAGMGGQEAMQRLLEIDPDVRGVVSSGYSQNPIMANHREHGFHGVVAKPFQIQTLGEALHEVLALTPAA